MTADTIITRGLAQDCPNNVGIMSVVKCRRGDAGTRSYSIRLNNGRFITDLPKNMYEDLKRETEKIQYLESDINQMIVQYKQQERNLAQQMGQAFNDAAEKIYSRQQFQKTPFNKK